MSLQNRKWLPQIHKSPVSLRGSCIQRCVGVGFRCELKLGQIVGMSPIKSNPSSIRRTSHVRLLAGLCRACQKAKQLFQISVMSRRCKSCQLRVTKTAFVETGVDLLKIPVGTILVPGGERMLTDNLENTLALELRQRTVGFP